jgi:hypothetical protein
VCYIEFYLAIEIRKILKVYPIDNYTIKTAIRPIDPTAQMKNGSIGKSIDNWF